MRVLDGHVPLRRGLFTLVALTHLDRELAALRARRDALRTRIVAVVDRFADPALPRVVAPEHHGDARAWLSAQLRKSTAAADSAPEPEASDPAAVTAAVPLEKHARHLACFLRGCTKVYRALLSPPHPGSPLLALAVGGTLPLDTPTLIAGASHCA